MTAIETEVDNLEADGTLTGGQAQALTSKLPETGGSTATSASSSLLMDSRSSNSSPGRTNPRAARGKLRAFVNQVKAFARTGILDAAQADALIDLANRALSALEG